MTRRGLAGRVSLRMARLLLATIVGLVAAVVILRFAASPPSEPGAANTRSPQPEAPLPGSAAELDTARMSDAQPPPRAQVDTRAVGGSAPGS